MYGDFDPYYTWLGIPRNEQPPNLYRLLGIRALENNPQVIAKAADQRLTYLRALQPGKNAAELQQLLNEVGAARACLLDATQKWTYDDSLRTTLGGHAPGAVPARRVVEPAVAAAPPPPPHAAAPPIAPPRAATPPVVSPLAATPPSVAPPAVAMPVVSPPVAAPPLAAAPHAPASSRWADSVESGDVVSELLASSTEKETVSAVRRRSGSTSQVARRKKHGPADRNNKSRLGWWLLGILGASVLAVAGVVAALIMGSHPADSGAPQAMLVFDWSAEERRDVKLTIDKEAVEFPATGPLKFGCAPGRRIIRAEWPGYAPMDKSFLLKSGQALTVPAVREEEKIVIVPGVPKDKPPAHVAPVKGHGLRAELFSDESLKNKVKERVDAQVDFVWGQKPPDDGIDAGPFSVRWTGWIKPPAKGKYRLVVVSDDGARVYVEKEQTPVLDSWGTHTLSRQTVDKHLDDRPYWLKVEYFNSANDAAVCLRWQRPGSDIEEPVPAEVLFADKATADNDKTRLPAPDSPGDQAGLLAEFFKGGEATGSPDKSRVDPAVDFFWAQLPPDPAISGKFVGRWQGRIKVPPSGAHRLVVVHDGHVRLSVDNRSLLNENAKGELRSTPCKDGELPPGDHSLSLQFEHEPQAPDDHAVLSLRWLPPGASREQPVPPGAFSQEPKQSSGAVAKLPRPSEEQQRPLREQLGEDPTDPAGKVARARELTTQGERTDLDPVRRFVALRKAAELSRDAWHARGAVKAVEAMDKYFEIEPAKAKAALLKPLAAATEVDLLGLVEFGQNVLHGDCQPEDKGLLIRTNYKACALLPVFIDGDYELDVEFTRYGREDATLIFVPVGDTSCEVVLGGWNGRTSGIQMVEKLAADHNPTRRQAGLTSGQRYKATVRVQSGDKARVEVLLDDKPYLLWQGLRSELSLSHHMPVPLRHVVLGATNSEVTFHSAKLRTTDGAAYLDLPGDPVLGPYWRTPRVGRIDARTYHDLAPAGARLAGLRVHYGDVVRAVQPIYGSEKAPEPGKTHGNAWGTEEALLAKPGYLVGGLNVRPGRGVEALQVVFMRDLGDRLDPLDRYASKWLGRCQAMPVALNGEGRPVLGIHGVADRAELRSAGLLFARDLKSPRPECARLTEFATVSAKAEGDFYVNHAKEGLWPVLPPRMAHDPLRPATSRLEFCDEHLFAHAPSKLVYTIPPKARSFTAVGYCAASQSAGFKVLLGGQVLAEAEKAGVVRLEADIPLRSPTRNLELVADPLAEKAFDHSFWLWPRFHLGRVATVKQIGGTPGKTDWPLTEMEPTLKEAEGGAFHKKKSVAGTGPSPPLALESTEYCDEFFYAHAESHLVFALPKGVREFSAVGYCVRSGSVEFRVLIDGAVKFRSGKAGIKPIYVRIPPGAKEIELVVDPLGDNHDDHACWCYPRLHR
jgi:hypothetical protein